LCLIGKPRNALEVYGEMMEHEVSLSETIPKKFDQTLIDVAMYLDADLVKEALQLLLLHKSQVLFISFILFLCAIY
jgi:hypothetical protein